MSHLQLDLLEFCLNMCLRGCLTCLVTLCECYRNYIGYRSQVSAHCRCVCSVHMPVNYIAHDKSIVSMAELQNSELSIVLQHFCLATEILKYYQCPLTSKL